MASAPSPQPATPAEFIHQARLAVKAGDRAQARRWLQQAARQDPQNYRVWLWLASVAPSPQASLEYIRRAEMLNPGDTRVLEARAWAERQLNLATAVTPSSPPIAPKAAHAPPPPVTDHKWWGVLAALLAGFILVAGLMIVSVWRQRQAPVTAQPPSLVANSMAVLPENSAPEGNVRTAVNTAVTPTPATPTPTAFMPAKQLGANDGQPRATWTVTPTPTPTFTPTPTWVPTFVSSTGKEYQSRPYGVGLYEKWVDVDLSSQTLTAYVGNDPVYSTLISSGTWEHPTVTGQFRIWLTYESQTMDGRLLGYDYYLENVPYVMYFYNDYALHGTFWHNNFGTPMSHGCVNMATSDAGWLYNWASVGTLVNVHN